MNESCRTLLIIDDDKPLRSRIAAFLKDSGYKVLEAADGASGLALFDRGDIELVITDLRLPGVDGLQVLRGLFEKSEDTPVIVISGAGVMSDVIAALRFGAIDYFIKPTIDLDALQCSVKKALQRRDLVTENETYRETLEQVNKDLHENLRILERDQLAGGQVQRRLLPKPLTCPNGYRAAQRIVPSLYLSGDFIDYAYIKKRYLAFYLADVSGHGASSAFVTIWLKHLVSKMVREEGLFADQSSFADGANTMLHAINRELNETSLGHHLTIFVGVIDTHSQQMRYAVAGHLPMPLLIGDDGAEFLHGSGKPVGIFHETDWQVYATALPKKFSLVCFSDGVLEILPPTTLQEKEAYLMELLQHNGQSLAAVCDAIGLDEVTAMPDDIAVLTITRGY